MANGTKMRSGKTQLTIQKEITKKKKNTRKKVVQCWSKLKELCEAKYTYILYIDKLKGFLY